ncbi:transmembrane amino acid transporter protein-domain-containing protein [Lineolata rhizophorae]|uniref:Transmembrane amino acid transporter protein-domain-containing protein n=1 Tax=Lineolata rhizophorae TaxID=578093 RepID=A0A6A6NRG1_9PEZI|nr:transmembrane amino acid transporter protein-domain-containing protein [Lineolata rhizophorae]
MASYAAINTQTDEHEARPASAASGRSRRSRRGKKDAGHAGQASWLSSVINLLNTIVGAGILAMPSAMSHMGILLGTVVILWAGLTAGFGLYLQTRCAQYLDRGTASFFALSQITYPNAAVVFDAAIAIKCFGVGVSYLIIIGDLMPGVARGFSDHAGEISFLVDRQFWITAFMLIVIPLSFLRRLDSLKYTSVVALISIGYLVILVLAHFIKGDTLQDRGPVRPVTWAGPVPALASFPVIVFAYTCHQNMFSILNEIANNSHLRTSLVVAASIGTAASLYIFVAITGYLSYGDNIGGNIVSMYAPSVATTVGRAAIVVLVMFSYPLQVHPCRASVDAVLKWRPKRFSRQQPSHQIGRESSPAPSGQSSSLLNAPGSTTIKLSSQSSTDTMTEARFAAITTVIIVLSYVVAMTVSSLEKVLAYVGSTGSTSISFILPGLFYYKIADPDSSLQQRLAKEDDDEDEEEYVEGEPDGIAERWRKKAWRKGLLRKLSLALAIYGGVVMVVCLATNTFLVAAH